MISPKFFLLLSGVLAMAAASNSFYPYSYYQNYNQQPSYQNYYQQPSYKNYYNQPSYQNFYKQPYQNFYQYQQQQSPFYQHQQFYPNFYQNQGYYNYPRMVLPNTFHFTGHPVADRLNWGTIGSVAAGVLGPLVGNLIGGN